MLFCSFHKKERRIKKTKKGDVQISRRCWFTFTVYQGQLYLGKEKKRSLRKDLWKRQIFCENKNMFQGSTQAYEFFKFCAIQNFGVQFQVRGVSHTDDVIRERQQVCVRRYMHGDERDNKVG